MQFLYTRRSGYTRQEIIKKLGASDGGRLSKNLKALIVSDFVVKYVPFGEGKREAHYKLADPFCLFYLHFINDRTASNAYFWEQNITSQPVITWRGLAFENVCFHHVEQIKKALGISGVISSSSAWLKKGVEEDGIQIDLLINRKDNVINMCELKYYGGDFTVDKDYYKILLRRTEILAKEVSPKTVVRSTLITTFGLTKNAYSSVFTNVITLDDLFA